MYLQDYLLSTSFLITKNTKCSSSRLHQPCSTCCLLHLFLYPTYIQCLNMLSKVQICFLLLSHRVHTVSKSPWSLGEVLEKSVNSIFPWKVLKLLCTSLRSPWIFFNFESSGLKSVFLLLFGCPRQNMNHRSENLKVIYTKCSMFCAIISCQFKTSELKNVEKLVKQTVQALKPY